MITSAEALQRILESSGEPSVLVTPLEAAAGLVLAEDVHADIDMPPFDRSAMDGFAVAGDSLRCVLLGEIAAGPGCTPAVAEGAGAPIMTGAPIPPGADRVVMLEDCTVDGSVLLVHRMPPAGANICRRGEDIRAGRIVLEAGQRLAPQHLGIAAMAGRGVLRVFRKPGITVLTTGSEVIPPTWSPQPGTVRNANAPLIGSLLALAGFPVRLLAHSADDPDSLRSTAEQLLEAGDVLIAAGGVSLGVRDYVPAVLESLGVVIRFRNVAQKPGKPLLFGSDPAGKPVFGLPGNPVSVMVALEEYVLPLLRRMSGFTDFRKRDFHGVLSGPFAKTSGRRHFLRVLAVRGEGGWVLHLPETSGSGDLMSVSATNALATVAEDVTLVEPGRPVPFHFLSSSAGELAFA